MLIFQLTCIEVSPAVNARHMAESAANSETGATVGLISTTFNLHA